MCVMSEMFPPKDDSSRRVPGLDGGVHSVAAIQPPNKGMWERLEKRMARRDVEVEILEDLAEERLKRSDFDGFRLMADRAWKRKERNWRVAVWMIRRHMEEVRAIFEGGAA